MDVTQNGAAAGGSAPQKRLDDDENQSQNATIRRIQRYRDDIAEYQLLFAQNELTREISEAQQHRSYHQLVKGYLQLLKPYLTADDIQHASEYWDEQLLGQFQIDPPEIIRKPEKHEFRAALGKGDRYTVRRANPRNSVEPKNYSVQGLRDFDASPAEWQEEWTVMFGPDVSPEDLRREINDSRVAVADRTHRNEPITVVRKARVPMAIIHEAVTAIESFIRDIGMDIEFDEQHGDAGFDYADILEEGPPDDTDDSGLLNSTEGADE